MKVFSTIMVATALAFVAAPHAKADDYDKFTKITVNEPVQLPKLVLQPGNYTLKLMEASGNRHVVQVADEKGKNLAIILALPNYRLVPRGKTTLQYWETPAGQPHAIRAWFFPGDNFGQEFAYPKSEADKIAAYNHAKVPTIADSASDLKTAKVEDFDDTNSKPAESSSTVSSTSTQTTTTRAEAAPAPQVTAQATPPPPPPAPTPAVVEQTPPPPARTTDTQVATSTSSTPSELPRTGSDLPLVGAIGVMALAGFLMISRKRRSA